VSPVGRIATGRNWLLIDAPHGGVSRVRVAIDASHAPRDNAMDDLLGAIAEVAGDAVADVALLRPSTDGAFRRERADEPPPLWQLENPRAAFECSVPMWDLVAAAWLIELIAWVYASGSASGTATVSVRHIEATERQLRSDDKT
jgi:hypothetical protein